jgi:LysM repeat protein
MIVLAIILAMGAFLMISIILERPETPAEAVPQEAAPANSVLVENEQVTLIVDPNQRPFTLENPPPAEPQVVEQPTATPDPALVAPVVVVAPEAAAETSSSGATTLGGGGLPAARIIFISYQVQPEDTLYRIQEKQITSIALMARFGISAEDIVVGNVLNLPVGDPNACGDWRPYVVLNGDTSFGLSQYYGITLAELQARNGLDANYSIYETEVICVPW